MVDFWAHELRELWSENERFIEHIKDHTWEDERSIHLLISEILNVQHIWTYRLLGLQPESDRSDKMPSAYWSELNQQNYLHGLSLLKDLEDVESAKAMEQWRIMQHIIKEVVYIRGRLLEKFQLSHQPILSTKFD